MTLTLNQYGDIADPVIRIMVDRIGHAFDIKGSEDPRIRPQHIYRIRGVESPIVDRPE